MKHFAKAKVIVGVHGAGMTNIVFNDNKELTVFEILPGKNLMSEHYKNISVAMGYQYDTILGNALNAEKKFSLDPEAFRLALVSVLEPT